MQIGDADAFILHRIHMQTRFFREAQGYPEEVFSSKSGSRQMSLWVLRLSSRPIA